jgi:hypothetical protein
MLRLYRQLGSEGNFQPFLARESENQKISPIAHPHLVKYLFTRGFNFFQNLINYKIDPALSYDIFFVSLHLLIQKLFRVEKYHQKDNCVRSLYVIYLGT